MERRSKRIVVTRPTHQSQSWIHRINQENLQYAQIPVLSIEGVSDEPHRQAIKNAIVELNNYAYLIFVSQNAVKFGFDWIENYWPQFPQGVICLSIGTKTQAAVNERLKFFSLNVQDQLCPTSRMNSEELLDSEYLKNVDGKKVLIFRGVGGRPKLQNELIARGAEVHLCELYHRKLPESARDALIKQAINSESDILTVFSGESLENFHQLLVEAKIANWQNMKVVVPSERVKKQAYDMGFSEVVDAENATEDAMWLALRPLVTST